MLYRLIDRLWPTAGQAGFMQHALPAMLAGVTSLLVCLTAGGPIAAFLKRRKVAERTESTPIDDEGLRRQIAGKSGTPTMGGLILLLGLVAGCLLWGDVTDATLTITLLCTLALGVLGAADDRMKLHGLGHRAGGLRPRQKLLYQACAGALVGALLIRQGAVAPPGGGASLVPLLRGIGILAPVVLMAWAALTVSAMSNATNVTDGLDGLLAGLTVPASLVLAAVACAAGGEASASAGVFFGALAGASMGFLYFNRHPARVFMGDTGALAVGGGMACAALAARIEVLLFIVGGVFLVEFGSSLLQIASFKLSGRRILPIAPVHHIPQKLEVPEPRIVRGFYLGGAVAALAGLTLFAL